MEFFIFLGMFMFLLYGYALIASLQVGEKTSRKKLDSRKQKHKVKVSIETKQDEFDPNVIRSLEKELGIITLEDLDTTPAERPQDTPKTDSNTLDDLYPLPDKYKWLVTAEGEKIYVAIVGKERHRKFVKRFGPNGGYEQDDEESYFDGYDFSPQYKTLLDFMRDRGEWIKSWTFQNNDSDLIELKKAGSTLFEALNRVLISEKEEADRKAALQKFVSSAVKKENAITPKSAIGIDKYSYEKSRKHKSYKDDLFRPKGKY